jgi:EmrB/QacA subfamily drug resistance transporter
MEHESTNDVHIHSAPAAAPALDPRRWKALALLGTAFFMVILDGTIVLTAIPSMRDDLGFSDNAVQWVITAYALCFGGLMLFFGRAADLLGRRRLFLVGIGLFGLSSLLCGLAWSAWVLVAARALQGIAAAIMAPAALSIVMTTFPEGAERNKALGIWGGLGGVGATAGLLIGGSITSALGWEWIFFLNLPIALAALVLGPVLLPEHRTGRARALDPFGAATVTAALILLVYAIIEAPDAGWTKPATLVPLAVSVALIVVFVLVERGVSAPLVPPRLLRLRTVIVGNAGIFAIGMAVDGMLFVLTLYAQRVLDYSAVQFGLMTAVMTVMAIVGALGGQYVVTRFGLRPVALAGAVLIAAGCLLLTRVSADGSYARDILAGLLVFGPGMGAAFVSAQIAALTGVMAADSGLASGLVDTSFNIGAALGIAIASTVAVSRTGDVLATAPSMPADDALTEGFQAALTATVLFAAVALVAAIWLPRRAVSDASATHTTTVGSG